MKSKKIIVALDSKNLNKTINLVRHLKKDAFAFKIGYQFFFNFGLEGYKRIYSICPKIFLDLKLHDIPNTVEKGLEALVKIKATLSLSENFAYSTNFQRIQSSFSEAIGKLLSESPDNPTHRTP